MQISLRNFNKLIKWKLTIEWTCICSWYLWLPHTQDRINFFILTSDLMHSSVRACVYSWEKDSSRAWKPKFDPILSRVLDALVPKIKAPDTKFSLRLACCCWDDRFIFRQLKFFVLFFWKHDYIIFK